MSNKKEKLTAGLVTPTCKNARTDTQRYGVILEGTVDMSSVCYCYKKRSQEPVVICLLKLMYMKRFWTGIVLVLVLMLTFASIFID